MKDNPFQVKLDQRTCSLCEVCAQRCPTGALSITRRESSLELFFDCRLCNGCDGEVICQEVCPEKSIEVVRTTPDDAATTLTRSGSLLLIRGELIECLRCGALFAPQKKIQVVRQKPDLTEKEVQEHCPDCRRELLIDNYPGVEPIQGDNINDY